MTYEMRIQPRSDERSDVWAPGAYEAWEQITEKDYDIDLLYERLVWFRERGRYGCTYVGEPRYDCTRPEARCCEMGDLKPRPRWRVVHIGGGR